MEDINKIVEVFELPANMRNYFQPAKNGRSKGDAGLLRRPVGFMDGLSFPASHHR
jgi:hypothetical protein